MSGEQTATVYFKAGIADTFDGAFRVMASIRREVQKNSGKPVHEIPDLGDDAFAIYDSKSRF